MRVLVGYFSETGNTRRIAQAIGVAAREGGHEVHVKSIEELTGSQLGEYDVVFLGSPCHSADVAIPVKKLLQNIPEGSKFKLAGFVTHSTVMPEGGEWYREMYERWAGLCRATFEKTCKDRGIDFLGLFHCQGAPNPEIEAFIRNTIIPDKKQWEAYITEARKHPTAEDIEAAKEFAKSLLAG